MYSVFQLAKKYIAYYLKAANGKGHGIHSPFVYDFITHVLLDKTKFPAFEQIEQRRKQLLNDKRLIEIDDFGAGSSVLPFKTRMVNETARVSLKSKKYSQLLFRIVKYFNSNTLIELGTSFGITTSYLGKATNGKVYTFEGAKSIADIAKTTFQVLDLNDIILTEGDFNETLLPKLATIGLVDFAFLDGNHRKQPTIDYFELFKNHIHDDSVLIFDDIHWSEGMEEAWEYIKNDKRVTLTIDLFFIGVVFFRKEFKARQHFTIRF